MLASGITVGSELHVDFVQTQGHIELQIKFIKSIHRTCAKYKIIKKLVRRSTVKRKNNDFLFSKYWLKPLNLTSSLSTPVIPEANTSPAGC